MEFSFVVNASVERLEGKFATREEIGDQLRAAIEGADPGTVDGENGGQYEVQSWDVEEDVEEAKPKAKPPTKEERVDKALVAAYMKQHFEAPALPLVGGGCGCATCVMAAKAGYVAPQAAAKVLG